MLSWEDASRFVDSVARHTCSLDLDDVNPVLVITSLQEHNVVLLNSIFMTLMTLTMVMMMIMMIMMIMMMTP